MDKIYIIILMLMYNVPSAVFAFSYLKNIRPSNITTIILFALILTGFYFLVTKGGYKLDTVDYFYMMVLGMIALMSTIRKSDKKTEQILKEERKSWKEIRKKRYIQRNANIYEFATNPCIYLYNNPKLVCTLSGTIDRDCFNEYLTVCELLLKKQSEIR